MINLIEAEELFNYGQIKEQVDVIELVHNKIDNVLELAYANNELIYSCGLRGVGKTTALGKIASKKKKTLIEPNLMQTKCIKERLLKEGICCDVLSESEALSGNFILFKPVIVDEGVDCEKLLDSNINIQCGFVSNKYNFVVKKKSYFKKETIEELKQELEILKDKKQKALVNNNNSDYKLLINNYKQVLELILELEKPQTTTTTWSLDAVANNGVDQFLNNGLNNILYKSQGLQDGVYAHFCTKDNIDEITDEVLRRIKEELNKTGKYTTHIMDC